MWREDGGRESLYSSPYMDDLNGVLRIVPCTNLNIDDILNIESSRDPSNCASDKVSGRNRAAEEPQGSRNPEPRAW